MAPARGKAAVLAFGLAALLPARVSRFLLRRSLWALGTALTLGMSKNRWTAAAWSRTAEPLLLNAIGNVVYAVEEGLVPALLSDNGVVTVARALRRQGELGAPPAAP